MNYNEMLVIVVGLICLTIVFCRFMKNVTRERPKLPEIRDDVWKWKIETGPPRFPPNRMYEEGKES